MSSPVQYAKVSWTIEADVLDQVRRRVPRGQQSAYATAALRRQLERDGLAEMTGELVQLHGALDEDAVQRFMDEWR